MKHDQPDLPGYEHERTVDSDDLAETITQVEAEGWVWKWAEVRGPGQPGKKWHIGFERRMASPRAEHGLAAAGANETGKA